MDTIGIITGSGPDAGIDLWQKVLRSNRESVGAGYRGDVDAPPVTIVSVPELGWSMDLPATNDQVWRSLERAARRLAALVDVYAIACNTLYAFESNLVDLDLPASLVSPVECVRRVIGSRGLTEAALLGAGPVSDLEGESPYRELRNHCSLSSAADPEELHQLIVDIKRVGGATPELESRFEAIVAPLGVGTAFLACTELPLVAAHPIPGVELIDVNQLMADELVRLARRSDRA